MKTLNYFQTYYNASDTTG